MFAWSMFHGNLQMPEIELEKIEAIKLLCVKYGLISLSLSDVSRVDFMLDSLCTRLGNYSYLLL